ncbi:MULTISPECIES: putative quinol monooxygenase [unclassified Maridesulfovibrio]|uniref:putative quinol monooxygenase n=1 Tax=unclassified Maridesulfovibrio TaxID=2794999 RepID=UPI003B3DF318
MIYLSASFQAKEGKEVELEKLLSGMIPDTAKEKGVQEYRLHRLDSSERKFFFYEQFESQEVLDSHFASAHYKNLVKSLDGLLESPPSVEKYTLLAAVPEGSKG